MRSIRRLALVSAIAGAALASQSVPPCTAQGPRIIQVIADKYNHFKVPGQKKAIITVKPKEVVRLRITAEKGPAWQKDGMVHSFTIKELKDQGWDLQLKEGTHEFTLVAPEEPGTYLVECLVYCGSGHDDMRMKLIVAP